MGQFELPEDYELVSAVYCMGVCSRKVLKTSHHESAALCLLKGA